MEVFKYAKHFPGRSQSDSFSSVEFESLLPQATSAALATAALFVASHALDQSSRGTKLSESVEISSGLEPK